MEDIFENVLKEIKKEGIPVEELLFFHPLFSNIHAREKKEIFESVPEGETWLDNICIIKSNGKGVLIQVKRGCQERVKEWISNVRPILFPFLDLSTSYLLHRDILDLIQEITTTRSLEEVYGRVTKGVCSLLKADVGTFSLYDPLHSRVYAVGPGYNVSPEEIKGFRFSFKGKSLAKKAYESGRVYCTNDAINDPFIKKNFVKYFNVDKVCCVPLTVYGKIFGFIYIARKHGGPPFGKEEIEILEFIASHISLLLKFLKTLEGFRKRSEALFNLDRAGRIIVSEMDVEKVLKLVVSVAVKLFEADASSLMVYDKQKDGYVIRVAEGLSEKYVKKQFVPVKKIRKFLSSKKPAPVFIKNLLETPFGEMDLIREEGIVSVLSVPVLKDKGLYGILNVYSKEERVFEEEDIDILEAFSLEVAIAIRNAELYEHAVKTTESMIKVLAELESQKDDYTINHSENVAKLALKIGIKMGLSQKELDDLYRAGLLHDVGKIVVERSILQKQGPLDEIEKEEMRKHPVVGSEIISKIEGLQRVARIVYHHHERYDGLGYPDGLKGEEIPLCSRILAVADAIEAMISHRPYRKPLSHEEMIKELLNEKGKQFDPSIVDLVIELLKRDST